MINKLSNIISNNKEEPLKRLRNLVELDLKKVDKLIYGLIENKISLIPDISKHTISSGGKRLRPILTLACSQMAGYSGQAHVGLAACVEFIHTATLLHDDVVDKSKQRRGASTANSLWGNKESILVGDYLLAKAFDLMGAANSLDVYRVLSNAAVVISEGEVFQLAATGKFADAENSYIKIISAKTAELFAASCEVGGILANLGADKNAALREFGMNLGIAFQIVDDALDYYPKALKLGKDVGDDFRERKVTLPVIIAFEQGDKKEKDFWKRTIGKGQQENGDMENALSLMEKYNVFEAVIEKAREYTKPAARGLDLFPDDEIREALIDVLNFTVEREF